MISRVALMMVALAGCAGAQHTVVVEPQGSYAGEVLVTAHQTLQRAMPRALSAAVPCEVAATLDARDMGRAAANFEGVAPSRLRIEVVIRAECDGAIYLSEVTHEVPAGVSANERRAALTEGVETACRMAARRLRADE